MKILEKLREEYNNLNKKRNTIYRKIVELERQEVNNKFIIGECYLDTYSKSNEVICVDKDSRTITYNGIANWWAFCRTHDVTHWLYVDDLLPKEGGEQ